MLTYLGPPPYTLAGYGGGSPYRGSLAPANTSLLEMRHGVLLPTTFPSDRPLKILERGEPPEFLSWPNGTFLKTGPVPSYPPWGHIGDSDAITVGSATDAQKIGRTPHHRITSPGVPQGIGLVGPYELCLVDFSGFWSKSLIKVFLEGKCDFYMEGHIICL